MVPGTDRGRESKSVGVWPLVASVVNGVRVYVILPSTYHMMMRAVSTAKKRPDSICVLYCDAEGMLKPWQAAAVSSATLSFNSAT